MPRGVYSSDAEVNYRQAQRNLRRVGKPATNEEVEQLVKLLRRGFSLTYRHQDGWWICGGRIPDDLAQQAIERTRCPEVRKNEFRLEAA